MICTLGIMGWAGIQLDSTTMMIGAMVIGISVDDMRVVGSQTEYVSGLPKSGDNAGGDPSPFTALGVFLGIEAAVETRLGKTSLEGVTVAVQGVGHVGANLCELLHHAGAMLLVADVSRANLRAVCDVTPCEVVSPKDILFSDVDVLAPCALGNVLNSETIPRIRAKVIAGAANNQLSDSTDGARLAERGILYAPDYVINAGGIINVSHEYFGDSSEEAVREDIARIPERLRALFADAESSGRPTNILADELARRIVENSSKNRELKEPTGKRRIA